MYYQTAGLQPSLFSISLQSYTFIFGSIFSFIFLFEFYVPVNNFSVMSGRVFLGWTRTKQGLMCLPQGHNAVTLMRLEPATLGLESSTLLLSHCATFGYESSRRQPRLPLFNYTPIDVLHPCYSNDCCERHVKKPQSIKYTIWHADYCKFGNFREDFIFAKCEVSWK